MNDPVMEFFLACFLWHAACRDGVPRTVAAASPRSAAWGAAGPAQRQEIRDRLRAWGKVRTSLRERATS